MEENFQESTARNTAPKTRKSVFRLLPHTAAGSEQSTFGVECISSSLFSGRQCSAQVPVKVVVMTCTGVKPSGLGRRDALAV
jgi:hypothetical protein